MNWLEIHRYFLTKAVIYKIKVDWVDFAIVVAKIGIVDNGLVRNGCNPIINVAIDKTTLNYQQLKNLVSEIENSNRLIVYNVANLP